jgi:hypothetical protein
MKNAERRAHLVSRAFKDAGVKKGESLTVATPGGEVHFETVTSNADTVSVHLAGTTAGGDPAFVIVNPPTLVPDPAGPILVNGMQFREDPLAAIATVIAAHGGAAQKSNRRRSR